MPLADPDIKNYAQFYQENGAFVLILGNFDPSNRFQTHQEIAKGVLNALLGYHLLQNGNNYVVPKCKMWFIEPSTFIRKIQQ